MRYILIILVFLSVGVNAQMVIKAHANYRPLAQPAANLLLDDYPNAAAAYSLRKLDKDYTGAAIRVRKDTTGQPEQDIGFTASGDLDTAALKSFLNARSGFVTTWYNQADAFHATQTTQANQPRIALNGVIDRQNGKPAVIFDGTNDCFITGISWMDLNSGNNMSAFTVVRTSVVNDFKVILSKTQQINAPSAEEDGWDFRISNTAKLNFAFWKDASYGNATSTTNETANTQRLFSVFANGGSLTTNVNLFGNGTEFGYTRTGTVTALDNNLYRLNIGAQFYLGSAFFNWNGSMQEIVMYEADKRTDRTGIENNINDYYNIYWNGDFTGLLDTYGSSAAAYSLRNLSSTYKGPLIRVRKDTTGQPEMDIYGDYYGNLDTVGLKNFLLTRSGFVTTWYDQSGNARNASQSTQANQPRIANLGVIERKNSKPTCLFDGNNDNLALATAVSISNQSFFVALNHAINITNTAGSMWLWRSDRIGPNNATAFDFFAFGPFTGALTNERLTWAYIDGAVGVVGAGETTTNINAGSYIYSAIYATTPSTSIHQNNTQLNLTNATGNSSSGFTAARYPAEFNRIGNSVDSYNGSIFEFILYPSNQTSNRSAITSNINTHYGIY